MAQGLGALAVLTEGPRLVPGTHLGESQLLLTLLPGDPMSP